MRYPTTPNAGLGCQRSLADIGEALAPVAHPVSARTRVTVSARRPLVADARITEWRSFHDGSTPCAARSNAAGKAWLRTRERALARQALRENLKNTLIRDDAKRGRSLMPDRGGEVKKLH